MLGFECIPVPLIWAMRPTVGGLDDMACFYKLGVLFVAVFIYNKDDSILGSVLGALFLETPT